MSGQMGRFAPPLSWSLKIVHCPIGTAVIVLYHHGTARGPFPTSIERYCFVLLLYQHFARCREITRPQRVEV